MAARKKKTSSKKASSKKTRKAAGDAKDIVARNEKLNALTLKCI